MNPDFKAGLQAFDRGEPFDPKQRGQWRRGWETARDNARDRTLGALFPEYERTRHLHEQDYFPPSWPLSARNARRAVRQERLAAWNKEYPELRAAYDRMRPKG